MEMSFLKYNGAFDEQFKEYLSDPEILLNNKISVLLDSTQEWLSLLSEFLTDLFHSNKWPEFYQIWFPKYSISISFFIEPLYNTLKQMGNNQENIIVKYWKIFSLRDTDIDQFMDEPIGKLIDTEYSK